MSKYHIYLEKEGMSCPILVVADDFSIDYDLSFSVNQEIVAVFSKYRWEYFVKVGE
jgi:hypothetical protein